MTKRIEYRVRQVARYVITRYEDDGKSQASTQHGIYDSEHLAERVATAMARSEKEERPTDHVDMVTLRAAAICLRCPEGFEVLSEALGMADTEEERGRLDDALKAVIRSQRPDSVKEGK